MEIPSKPKACNVNDNPKWYGLNLVDVPETIETDGQTAYLLIKQADGTFNMHDGVVRGDPEPIE